MAVFVNDTFTDTNGVLLQNHTGETGATWTEHPDVAGVDATIQSNKASSLSNSGSAYYASGAPATAEYDVELTTGALSSPTMGMGPQGRLLATPYTGYLAWASGASSLYKHVAGAFTEIGSYAGAVPSGTVIKLQIRDATKKVFLDGVERISSTNNDVTGAGKAGLRFYSDAVSPAIVDTFSATDAASGITAALTGQSITAAQGSLTAAITAPITGQSVPLGQGTVTVDPGGVSRAVTGQAANVVLGNVSPVVSVALTGQSIPLALGNITQGFERAIAGQGVTASVGSVSAAVAPTLSGQSITVSVGSVGVGGNITRALAGQGLTVSLGNLTATSSQLWTTKALSADTWIDKPLSSGTWTDI